MRFEEVVNLRSLIWFSLLYLWFVRFLPKKTKDSFDVCQFSDEESAHIEIFFFSLFCLQSSPFVFKNEAMQQKIKHQNLHLLLTHTKTHIQIHRRDRSTNKRKIAWNHLLQKPWKGQNKWFETQKSIPQDNYLQSSEHHNLQQEQSDSSNEQSNVIFYHQYKNWDKKKKN